MVIGIGHKARHGKDTAASFLQKKYNCEIIHFADALYDECRNTTVLYDEDRNIMYLKAYDEDYNDFPEPSQAGIDWIKEKGSRRENLPENAQWIYEGMKEKDPQMLQFYGTEYRRRRFNWDYWVEKSRQVIEKAPDKNYLIPDTRFRNEAEFIKSIGGQVWKVVRPGLKLIDRDPNHTSEVDLDNWDFDVVLINDGTIEDLEAKTDKIFRQRVLKKDI